MAMDLTTLFSALIGAVVGSIGAASVSHALQQRSGSQQKRRSISYSYLYQCQDSLESLWYRFDNFANRGGRAVVDEEYSDLTMLYSLGRSLASERLLIMSDVMPQLDEHFNGLGTYLRLNRVDSLFQGIGFHRYDRVTLAELVMTEKNNHFRLATFIEFRSRYGLQDSHTRVWLKPALSTVQSISMKKLDELLEKIEKIVKRLSDETGVPTTIKSQR